MSATAGIKHWSQKMTKAKSISRISRLTVILASGIALTGAADLAHARGGNHQGSNQQSGMGLHPVLSQQPAKLKHLLPMSKPKPHISAGHKKIVCRGIIVPTRGCAISSKDPVGHTHPTIPTEGREAGKPGAQKKPVLENIAKPSVQPISAVMPAKTSIPAPGSSITTISNGVTNSVLASGKGLTVSANANGTLTVSNGTNAVTLAGGSLTLKGAPSVAASSGVQIVRLANGDYSVAANAASMSAPSSAGGASNVPPGVTFGDDLKFVGAGLGAVASAPVAGVVVIAGAPIAAAVGAVQGHPLKTTEHFVDSVANWIGAWF